MKYNYIHATNRISKKKYKYTYEKFLSNKFFKPQLNWYYFKHQILPFFIYGIVMICLFLIDYFRCSLIYWINRQHLLRDDNEINKFSCSIPRKFLSSESQSKGMIDNPEFNAENFLTQFILADLIRNILNFGETFVYVSLIYLTNRYPWKKDYFLMFKEYIYILGILLFFNDFVPLIYYFVEYSAFLDYINNFSRIFCLLLVFTYCNYRRYHQRLENINILILDFDNFMNFLPFYNHLQDNIIKNNENDLRYLDFWVNYHNLDNKIYAKKKLAEQLELVKSSNLPSDFDVSGNTNILKNLDNEINEKIYNIHKRYYGGYNTNANIDSNLTSFNSNSQIEFKIDFPIDMQEKVEDCIIKNIDVVDIKEIFEESYNFVCHHLSNIHSDITIKDKEILERILYLMNFFEVNEEIEIELIK